MRRIGIVAAALGIWGACTAGKPAGGPDGGAGSGGTSLRCLGATTCRSGSTTSVFACEPNHTPGRQVTTCKDDTGLQPRPLRFPQLRRR